MFAHIFVSVVVVVVDLPARQLTNIVYCTLCTIIFRLCMTTRQRRHCDIILPVPLYTIICKLIFGGKLLITTDEMKCAQTPRDALIARPPQLKHKRGMCRRCMVYLCLWCLLSFVILSLCKRKNQVFPLERSLVRLSSSRSRPQATGPICGTGCKRNDVCKRERESANETRP